MKNLIQKLKYRYAKWKDWKRFCGYFPLKKLLILLGIKRDYWFDHYEIIAGRK